MQEEDFSDKVNHEVTIQGVAMNASLGAILMTEDDTPVYLDGIQEWEVELVRKELLVTGVLRYKSIAPTATVDSEGRVSHGVGGDNYVLENSSWTGIS
jgi:hypothetical protein